MGYTIPLIRPFVSENLKRRVMDVIDSGYWTEGTVTAEFEKSVADYCGAAHCLAVTSCTTGLELALRCLGIGPGDEVIVPDYTYPATASAVNIVGATAVLVDVDPETLLIDYDVLEDAVTPQTRAAIPVSLFGNPMDWGRLHNITARHSIFIIEDAACALGASYNSHMTGSLADITVFSHHPRKFITTGEGGTVCTDNTRWAEWMHSYKHFGMAEQVSRGETHFVRVGTNYKLSNILAAVGLAQMEKVQDLLSARQDLAARYTQLLADVPGISLTRVTPGGEHACQTFCVRVTDRDRIMAGLRNQGIEAQIGSYSLHMHEAFASNSLCRIQGEMAGSRQAFSRCLALPLFYGMTQEEQDRVVSALKSSV